jgi:hypothetical protein
MTTHDSYVTETPRETWNVPVSGDARFTWEYDEGRARLLALYQKGKDKQWDAQARIDWSLEVDKYNVLGLGEESCPIYGSPTWGKLGQKDKDEMFQHLVAWQFSQFLHGEQGAMICSARIVEAVPDLDAKFYASTQTMDEARHAETYARFLQEKVQLVYPINPHLQALLATTLSDSRWDMPYLGMQVLIEGLALAAFGLLRDTTTNPLPKQILSYVMQDEARHVAFGRMALKDAYADLTAAERDEREEFVVEACYLMRDRFRSGDVWEYLGYDVEQVFAATEEMPGARMFRNRLFTRIVPCIKDIGLWGDRVRSAYADMGVLEYAAANLDGLMADDERIADDLDEERRAEARCKEVADTIAVGADS